MKPLALPKLPDRNPVKRTIVCEPELNKTLEEYALLYRETYGEGEPVETLIPFMLSAFLAKDRAFVVFRRAQMTASGDEQNRRKRAPGAAALTPIKPQL